MGLLPKKWIKWIAVGIGVAGILTLPLLELGWIPEHQAMKAVIFLLSFIILDGVAARESDEASSVPELFTDSEDHFRTIRNFWPDTKHEQLAVVPAGMILAEGGRSFVAKMLSAVRSEKRLHVYTIVAAPISEWSEAAFEHRFAIERDPSLEGRARFRVVDTPVSFGCQVFDQNHWGIMFPPNPADPGGGAIVFKDHPEGARLVASFIRHQWLERPGVTMSLTEAYEKWKALRGIATSAE